MYFQFNETRVTAAAEWTPGKVVWVPDQGGAKAYVYVQADASGITGTGFVAVIDPSTYTATTMVTTTNAAPGTGTGKPCGVARAAVPASNFCWLQVYGPGLIQVGASCAAFTLLNTTATAGMLDDDATVGARRVSGVALTAARTASNGTAAGLLNWPQVEATL